MVTGIVAGLAAGALWGLLFVAPRMLSVDAGGYSSVDLTSGRFAVYGAAAAVMLLLGLLGLLGLLRGQGRPRPGRQCS